MKYFSGILILMVFSGLLTGCSTTRHLSGDQYLLRQSNLKLKTDVGVSEKGILADELRMLELQRPNTYLFDIFPYKLWLYNMRYQKYQRDTANFQITNKVVEKPVVFDSSLMSASTENMRDFLRNQGYFYAHVADSVHFRHHRAYVQYRVHTGRRFRIDSLFFDVQDPTLRAMIPLLRKNTLLSRHTVYSNTLAGEERSRLVNQIRDLGYYKFTVDNISFELDTLGNRMFHLTGNPFESAITFLMSGTTDHKSKRLNIRIIIHPNEEPNAFQKYRFNKVIVFPDFNDSLGIDSANYKPVYYEGLEFRFHDQKVNTGILDKKIFIRPGRLYAQSDYNQTLRQLNDLGIFQYVRLYMIGVPGDSTGHLLNCYVLMTPNEKYNFQTNVEISGGDLYAVGTAANVSVTDNNFLKGANQLTTTLSYGLELGQNKTEGLPFLQQFYFFSRNVGFNFRLSFPKFLLPVNQQRFSREALPHTFIDAGINSLTRINYFSLRSINGSFGYLWKETPTKSWSVKPVFVNVLHLSNIYPSFQERMDTIQAIRNSYQETFIEGEDIEYVINTAGVKKGQYIYLKLGLEEAGALMGAVKGVSGLADAPLDFTNAHYFRLDFDARQYFLRRDASFILRFAGGIGVPYAGSTVLPYIKQYFVGGAYSIRGWRPRVLGPGSYRDPNQNDADELFVDQAGDIKLEWNAEYRFNMIKLFSGAININGAVFADAGNIWLAHRDPSLPGADFKFDHLYQDIALSSGAGLRLDLGGFLVVRLDWAIPLKAPYIMDNHGWVVDKIHLSDAGWRRENMNLNVAIGYPF
ncbi:MAG TPA: BamA/TamA family outer membrane protein [Edaphocola sp.]|nr:BamA/TamA family outer membrane protein [Edaphocola sp.]